MLPNSQSLASLEKALLQVRRQLGNQERGKEDEFGKALLSDVTEHGFRGARLCPQFRKIKVTALLCCHSPVCRMQLAVLLHELLAVSEALASDKS